MRLDRYESAYLDHLSIDGPVWPHGTRIIPAALARDECEVERYAKGNENQSNQSSWISCLIRLAGVSSGPPADCLSRSRQAASRTICPDVRLGASEHCFPACPGGRNGTCSRALGPDDVLFGSLGFAQNLFQRSHTLHDLVNPVDVKRFHAIAYGLLPNLDGRDILEDHFADFRVDEH